MSQSLMSLNLDSLIMAHPSSVVFAQYIGSSLLS